MRVEAVQDSIALAMERINQAWLSGRVDDMAQYLHPEIVGVSPGFSERVLGRESFVEGHREFVREADIQDFRERDLQIDVINDTAVVNYRYEMIYERGGKKYRSLGRDLWVYRLQGSAWLGVWRTVMEVDEREM